MKYTKEDIVIGMIFKSTFTYRVIDLGKTVSFIEVDNRSSRVFKYYWEEILQHLNNGNCKIIGNNTIKKEKEYEIF